MLIVFNFSQFNISSTLDEILNGNEPGAVKLAMKLNIAGVSREV